MPSSPPTTDTGPVAPTDLQPSSGLRRAAVSERRRIDRLRERLEVREQRLRAQLQDVRAELAALDERRDLIDKVIAPGEGAGLEAGRSPGSGSALRGRQLRERATRLLFERYGPGCDVHYRQWLDDVLSAGCEVSANDAPAAFLTTVSRSPLVARGAQPGTYRIDLSLVQALRQKRTETAAELADVSAVIARDANPSASLREHRTRLTAELKRVERDLGEADRVLGGAQSGAGGLPAIRAA